MHRLLIAGIGDDIHSIGISLIAMRLEERGFFVRNLGVGNHLDRVFEIAIDYDAILISCNNGHAALYLDDFPLHKKVFERHYGAGRLWYLGGNMSVSEDERSTILRYRHFGFDFVAPKPIGLEPLYEQLQRDLHDRALHKRPAIRASTRGVPSLPGIADVTDEPLSDSTFMQLRTEVLSTWESGRELYNLNVHGSHRDKTRNLSMLLSRSHACGSLPLLQPRTGVAHIRDEVGILKHLRSHGSDIASIQLDAASRKNMYKEAERGLRMSTVGGRSFLNGYPVPIHGVNGMRQLVAATESPFQIRAGGPDHRLTYEIGLAGGATSLEGGFLCYLLPYDVTTSPIQSLKYWKYVDKLAGSYWQRHRIIINREYFGPLTTTLIEPTVPICINLVQGILSAKSGVKCVSVGLAEQGNRAQDIAAVQVLREQMVSYLRRVGYPHVRVSTVFHQYMGAFPRDPRLARVLIEQSAITGALAGATKILTKTPVEAIKIPSRSENADGLRLAKVGISHAHDTEIDRSLVHREYRLLKSQVESVMALIEELGDGTFARGLILALQCGALEVPFSPSQYSTRQQVTLRDSDGAVRFLRPDLLSLEPCVADYHEQRLADRMADDGTTSLSELVRMDLTRIPDGEYSSWPLDRHQC